MSLPSERLHPTLDLKTAADLLARLQARIEGEVHTDPISRILYSTDASVYQETPLGVVRPRHKADCVEIMRFAAEHRLPLIPRAGGTSLAGQCVGNGLVVDVSRYMTAVLAVDPAARTATVQPGVILDDLNDLVGKHGLLFGPDTSTSNRCMIGGMIGNNSCGSHSILYGTTRDHVISVEAVLHDGSLVTFGPLDEEQLAEKLQLQSAEGEVYRAVHGAVAAHRELILGAYPDPRIVRRNTGYPLDAVANARPFDPEGPPFNLATFLTGTEGTLALITEAHLKLVPKPRHRLAICAHFDTLDASMRATVTAVGHAPAAVELIDDAILAATSTNLEQARNRAWLVGAPAAVLAIELFDDDKERLEARAVEVIADLEASGLGYAFPIVRPPELGRVWELRKAGLGALMGVPGDVKAVTCIEDTAVAVEDLPEYVRGIAALMQKYDTRCVYYAHASVGELHLRPELNLKDPGDLKKFRDISVETADLVKRFGGSLSGEHGDGRLRGEFVQHMLGDEVFGLLRTIKAAFDPHNLLNPAKIIDAEPMDTDLRADPGTPDPTITTFFDWSADMGLLRAAEKCNGAGACRKSPGRGTMCPSYMATREEKHTTRGRANVLRTLLIERRPDDALTADALYEVLDLCLSCKGCKSECPANVDLARMKAEVLQHRHDRYGVPLRARAFGNFATLGKLAALTPGLASWGANTAAAKALLGVHPKRSMPRFSSPTLTAWARRHTAPSHAPNGEVVLFNDAFTDLNDAHIGIAATELFEAAGWRVHITRGIDAARAQISKGLLREAKVVLAQAVEALHPFVERGVPIFGLEPSSILTFRDEAPDLLDDPDLKRKAHELAPHALLFEELIVREHAAGRLGALTFKPGPRAFVVHGHCHQKAIASTRATLDALKLLPDAAVRELPTGCCGMAGSFGYEKEHYDLSMQIAELVLLPAARALPPDAVLVASGTSCRHQLHDGAHKTALHPAQILRDALQNN